MTARLQGFTDKDGSLAGYFDDGTEVRIHKDSQQHVFYVMRPSNLRWVDEPMPVLHVVRAYQWAALEAFFCGQHVDVDVDPNNIWTATPRAT